MALLDLRNPVDPKKPSAGAEKKTFSKHYFHKKISPTQLMFFKMFGVALSLLFVVLAYKNFAPVDLQGNINNQKIQSDEQSTPSEEVSLDGSENTFENTSQESAETNEDSDGVALEEGAEELVPEKQKEKEVSLSNLSTDYVTFRLEKPIIEAGHSLLLTSSATRPGAFITFNVAKDDEAVSFSATANASGIAVVRIPGEKFIEAGTYQISISSSASILSKGIKPLLVKAGKVSADETIVETDVSSLSVGQSSDFLVKVYDTYHNPIPNSNIKILKNTNDTLSTSSVITNQLGEGAFTLKKATSQDVTLQILDSATGSVLEEIIIEGVAPTSPSAKIDGNSLVQNLFNVQSVFAQSSNNVFSFSGIQSQVPVNSPISFTLTVMDSDNVPVTDYTGTVSFTSNDATAELPNDYTFVGSDNGSKFFIGDMSFSTAGTHLVTATDTSNAAITGVVQVSVGGDSGNNSGDADVTILSPLSGNTLNSNTINIAGTADSGGTVNIFDGVIQIGSTQAGPNGDFFFTTKALTDGQHKLRAESNGAKSEEVSIIVDTNSPEVDKITISPKTVPPGTNINVEVQTEPALTRVKFIADGRQIDLVENPSKPGVYTGSFRAPASAGLFKVDIELSDTLNNPSLYEGVETFTVRVGDPLNPDPEDVTPTPGDDLIDPIGNVPKTDETGPEELIVVIFALSGLCVFLFTRKSNPLQNKR